MASGTILLTGGAGYIGSHTALCLKERGHDVVVLDNLSRGHREVVTDVLELPLVVGDVSDQELAAHVVKEYDVGAVMHFAALAYVGESVCKPAEYYVNNVLGSVNLLAALLEAGVRQVIFSSSCATYGNPDVVPIVEGQRQRPVNPYGSTKLAVETMLRDFDHAYGMRHVILRYFNAAGGDPECRIGESHDPETHLIPLILNVAAGRSESIRVFGTDYPTDDGTCVRDYIHVNDVADAHVRALEFLDAQGRSDHFNVGTGRGHSVREVIAACERVCGVSITVEEEERRPGDPPVLVASNSKARENLGWEPAYSELEDIVRHAWAWAKRDRE